MGDFSNYIKSHENFGEFTPSEIEHMADAWDAAVRKFHRKVCTETTVYDSFGPEGDRIDSIKNELITTDE